MRWGSTSYFDIYYHFMVCRVKRSRAGAGGGVYCRYYMHAPHAPATRTLAAALAACAICVGLFLLNTRCL